MDVGPNHGGEKCGAGVDKAVGLVNEVVELVVKGFVFAVFDLKVYLETLDHFG